MQDIDCAVTVDDACDEGNDAVSISDVHKATFAGVAVLSYGLRINVEPGWRARRHHRIEALSGKTFNRREADTRPRSDA